MSDNLLIPYKRWSGDPQEEQNYYEIERWAKRLQTVCMPKGVSGGPVTITVSQREYFGTFSVPNNRSFDVSFNTMSERTSRRFGTAIVISGGTALLFTAPGYVSWWCEADPDSTAAPPAYVRFETFTWNYNMGGAQQVPLLPAQPGGFNTNSGNYWTEANDRIFVNMRHTAGATTNIAFRMGISLLEIHE